MTSTCAITPSGAVSGASNKSQFDCEAWRQFFLAVQMCTNLLEVGPRQRGKELTRSRVHPHYGGILSGVQTLVGRFVFGAGFVAIRQTFVLGGHGSGGGRRHLFQPEQLEFSVDGWSVHVSGGS